MMNFYDCAENILTGAGGYENIISFCHDGSEIGIKIKDEKKIERSILEKNDMVKQIASLHSNVSYAENTEWSTAALLLTLEPENAARIYNELCTLYKDGGACVDPDKEIAGSDSANTGPGISKRHDDTRAQPPDTDKKSALNEVLRLLRIAQDLSTRDVADKMGVRTSYITDVERGDRSPSIDTLDRYCLALGVTTDVLFRLRNEQIKENLPYRRLLMKIVNLLENTDEGTC